ncbi:MAG: peptidase MA family metallohydrolase [Elusimicrobiota bacterium]
MEALSRIRLLIWILLLSLWGIMVYQYLGKGTANPQWPSLQNFAGPSSALTQVITNGRFIANENRNPFPAEPESGQAGSAPADQSMLPTPPPEAVGVASPVARKRQKPSRRYPAHQARKPRISSQEEISGNVSLPPGFVKTITTHFIIYSEGTAPSKKFLEMAELLHGNIMIDLAAFSPWAFDQRVTIFLFKNQKTYHTVTGRPEWSGGATSVENRRIYIYETPDIQSILAHELCHVYYDGFYIGGTADPMWLSEGMATFMQVERGLAKPDWLRPNLKILEEGGGYSLTQLMNVTTLSGASDAEVQIWYTESYSIVRFLTRLAPKSGFYKFSDGIRNGENVTQALYAAYGMPYNRIKALEYAWRYDLAKRSLKRVGENFHAPTLTLDEE